MHGLIGWGDPTGGKKTTNTKNYPSVSNISGTTYDVARTKWGGKWRIPTKSEYEELITACNWSWESRLGYYGYKVTGPNGNNIFLPVTGYRVSLSVYSYNTTGFYWTGTMRPSPSPYPYALIFGKTFKGLNTNPTGGLAYPDKIIGCAIRPVQDK